jgi:hypothetical protein
MEEIVRWPRNTTRRAATHPGVVRPRRFSISWVRPPNCAAAATPNRKNDMLHALTLTLLATTLLLLLGAAWLRRAASRTERELAGLHIVLPAVL